MASSFDTPARRSASFVEGQALHARRLLEAHGHRIPADASPHWLIGVVKGAEEAGVLDDPNLLKGAKFPRADAARAPGRVERFDHIDPWSPLALRADFGIGPLGGAGFGSSPDAETEESPDHPPAVTPESTMLSSTEQAARWVEANKDRWRTGRNARPQGPEDDSRSSKKSPSNDNPYESVTFSEANQSVPATPRSAFEHVAPGFGGGNQGSAEGGFQGDSADFGSETRDAQTAMLRRAQDKWKAPRRERGI